MDNAQTRTATRLATKDSTWPVVVAVSLVLGLWLAWLLGLGHRVADWFGDEDKTGLAGQFGDMFGSINALFTALAFWAVWRTGRMQHRQLALQTEELEMQRQELALQRKELAATRTIVNRQTFESMFFQMLRLTREIHEELVYFRGNDLAKGTAAMAKYADLCRSLIKSATSQTTTEETLRDRIGSIYLGTIYDKNTEPILGPFFRSLYHLYKLIDAQNFRSDVKRRYANIARAQLSSSDLVVLAANACSGVGEGFRPYIERYGILKHYPEGASMEALLKCFDTSAFASFLDDEPDKADFED